MFLLHGKILNVALYRVVAISRVTRRKGVS